MRTACAMLLPSAKMTSNKKPPALRRFNKFMAASLN
jgi:hypothetical protein